MQLIENIFYILMIHLLNYNLFDIILLLFPLVLFLELPFYLTIIISILYKIFKECFGVMDHTPYYPGISCIVTCYNEGKEIERMIKSLVEQLYKGHIEILLLIDGADVNKRTLMYTQRLIKKYSGTPRRVVKNIPKSTRGGRASSCNLGLTIAKYDFIVILDADCSCDNDMVERVSSHFSDESIIAVSGVLRARNAKKTFISSMQSLEYMISIHMNRIGLSQLNCLNNISGAFGVFRKSVLKQIGGWKNGTAEDLDLTTRLQTYLKRYPQFRVIHDHHAVVHTDVPETFLGLLKQRLRWDGDLYYIFIRRHWKKIRPKFLGLKRFSIFLLSNLFFNIISPLLIISYTIYGMIFFNVYLMLAIFILIYAYYLFVISIFFTIYICLVSERKREDLFYLFLVPIMPLYQLSIRFWAGISIIIEFFLKTHKDTSMAPWWIIRKS